MKILITAASGQVGWEQSRCAAGKSVVVNAAAYTSGDQTESKPEPAFAVNRKGPAYLTSAWAVLGVPLVHISTDLVYDNQKRGPYLEKDSISSLRGRACESAPC